MKAPLFIASWLAAAALSADGTIVDASELSAHLGRNGTASLPFSVTTEVLRACSTADSSFFTRSGSTPLLMISEMKGDGVPLAAGDVIHAVGQTERITSGLVFPVCGTATVVGHRKPAEPIHATVNDILNGKHPFVLVTVEGLVLDAFLDDIDRTFGHIILTAGRDALGLHFFNVSNEYVQAQHLIGASISATGIYWPNAPGWRKIIAPELYIRSLDNVQVLRHPPPDPFAVPELQSLQHMTTTDISTLGRHRAEGHVIAVWGRNMFMLKGDGGTIVNVRTAGGATPRHGDFVVAAGLPETDRYRLNLKRAIWKKTAGPPLSEDPPTAVSVAQLLTNAKSLQEIKPHYHGRPITLKGRVTSIPSPGSDSGVVQLEADGFTITVDASACPSAFGNVAMGSVVEVTGICLVKTESLRPNEPIPMIEDVAVVLRNDSDVAIIEAPPWWTAQRLFVLVAVLVAVIFLVVLWNLLLHRVSERRGNALAKEKVQRMETALKVEERTRIAVELHDSLAQNLTGVSLEIDSAEQLAGRNFEGMLQHLRIAARTLQSCRNELRNCLWDLRCRALEEKDLNEAIRRAIAPQTHNADLSIRFCIQRQRLTDDMAHVMMRTIRELAINAVRHGHATAVKIAGSDDGDRLRFSVCDNGSGFDPETRPGILQGHFGLQGIQERIAPFKGTMDIESRIGKGTRVSISLDMPPAAHAGSTTS